MVDEEQEERELTPGEIEERRRQILTHYQEQIPFLEVHKQYQTLVTEIEELRARQVRASVMIANIMAPPPEQPVEDSLVNGQPKESIVPPHERKLKKEHA